MGDVLIPTNQQLDVVVMRQAGSKQLCELSLDSGVRSSRLTVKPVDDAGGQSVYDQIQFEDTASGYQYVMSVDENFRLILEKQ